MTRPPADMLSYTRTDGKREMRMIADPKYGLPYGADIVALYGLCTRGREESNKYGKAWNGIVSFSSTAEMLRYFGEPPTQYYYRRRMGSLMRIWGTRMVFEDTIRRASETAERKHFFRADFLINVKAWFQLDDNQMGMPFENEIQFSPEMMDWIRNAPMFEDAKVFLLKQSIGMLQLYLLLRDRCASTSLRDRTDKHCGWIPLHGPKALESQLGWLRKPEPREIRRMIEDWLDGIRSTVWPECPGELHKGRDETWRLLVQYVPPLFRP